MFQHLLLSIVIVAGLAVVSAAFSHGAAGAGATAPAEKPAVPVAEAGKAPARPPGPIFLVVRADDLGSSHAANVACIRACREGIARSVEVMVPCTWFAEAVQMLAENPDIDVGIHLTLTSEWEGCRWGPLTGAPSLVREDGCFFPQTRQRPGAPPNTGFLDSAPDLDEVEKELRAQIELAMKQIKSVSHISSHMGTPTASPELREITERLAREYELPLGLPDVKTLRPFRTQMTPEEKVEAMVKALEVLDPGVWLLVDHPGLDTPEMRALGHTGYRDVARDRAGVTQAFTAEEVKAVIRKRKIRLVSYADVLRGG